MTAAVRPMRESAPWIAISSEPTAKAALPLMGRISTNMAVSGGIPKKEKNGDRISLRASIAPDARSIVTAVMSRTKVGTMEMTSFNPFSAPFKRRL